MGARGGRGMPNAGLGMPRVSVLLDQGLGPSANLATGISRVECSGAAPFTLKFSLLTIPFLRIYPMACPPLI
jgi:hypothetical protein